jgi:hypothetical protein
MITGLAICWILAQLGAPWYIYALLFFGILIEE